MLNENNKYTDDNTSKLKKYWLIAPGENARLWDEFYNEGIIAIGWELNNLSVYKSKEEIKRALRNYYHNKKPSSTEIHALWQFTNEIQIGDIVCAKKGINKIIGVGIIESDYIYDNTRKEYKHTRKVKWIKKGAWKYKNLIRKTLTEITNNKYLINKIKKLLGDITIPTTKYPEYGSKEFLEEAYISSKEYETLKKLLHNKKNIIIQGAPGVGKTFIAKRLAYSLIGMKDLKKVKMIQFHQSYSYEDFIMGYRPYEEGFKLKHGSFYTFCKKASKDSENDYFFIIDEINRGNLSKIFGELFMLIEHDKRGDKIPLLYSDELFTIPENLYIIGLMNTSDRSLAMIDYALRRRFAFFNLKPGFSSNGFEKYQKELDNTKFDRIINLMKELNKDITEDESLGEGFTIGHSYFCNLNYHDDIDEKLTFIIEYEIIPLLKEYWFDDIDKVENWSEKIKQYTI